MKVQPPALAGSQERPKGRGVHTPPSHPQTGASKVEQWGTPQEAGVLGAWQATPTTQQHQRCPQDTP